VPVLKNQNPLDVFRNPFAYRDDARAVRGEA